MKTFFNVKEREEGSGKWKQKDREIKWLGNGKGRNEVRIDGTEWIMGKQQDARDEDRKEFAFLEQVNKRMQ